jgi:anti-anti-sigma factor
MSTFSRAPAPDVHALGWSTCRVGDRCVVSVGGELDIGNVALFQSLLSGLVESGRAATIVLDMSRVEFIDACSIGVIVEAAGEAARRPGGVLRVAGLRGLPERVFELLGLESLVVCRDGRVMREG